MRSRFAGLAIAFLALGCLRPATEFPCTDSAQCVLDGRQGSCETTGFCSFPDATCSSGRRYGAHASTTLANDCVAPGGGDMSVVCTPGHSDGGTCGPGDMSWCCGSSCTVESSCPGASCSCAVHFTGGTNHTCVLLAADQVYCFGKNDFSQLGDDTFTGSYSTTPRPLHPAVTDVVELVSGGAFNCVRRGDGSIWCWGNNNEGELGNTTDRVRAAAMQVPGLPALASDPAVQLVAGHFHVCARLRSGAVWCWGGDTYGQLGDGKTGMNLLRATPAAAPWPTTPVSIAAGGSMTLALMADDTLWAVGDNSYGQMLADPMTVKQATSPKQLASDVKQVVAGDHHICVRHSTGQVECWGRDDGGQVGDGMAAAPFKSTAATVVDGMGVPIHAAAIVAGFQFTCALRTTGDVVCWGVDDRGQLGDGMPTAPGLGRSAATPLAGTHPTFAAVETARNFTFARALDGSVWSWGDDTYGQLGNQTQNAAPAATPMSFPLCCK